MDSSSSSSSSLKNPNYIQQQPPFPPPPPPPQFHHQIPTSLNHPPSYYSHPQTQTQTQVMNLGYRSPWFSDLSSNFRFRDGFCSFGYGNDHTAKDDYYLSEIEPYLDHGSRKSSDEPNRTSNEVRQDCENAVNSSVETVVEIDGDAGKYTSVVSISSSPRNVAGKGSLNVRPLEEASLSVKESCKLDNRGLKVCLSESSVSLSKDINDSSRVLETGSGNTDSECAIFEAQLCYGSLRNSYCMVPDSSVSLCQNEQIHNSASSVEGNCNSQCGIVDTAEDMDIDVQEEMVKADGTSGTDSSVTVSGDVVFLCGSFSTVPRLVTGQIQNETHIDKGDETKNSKECNEEEVLVDASQGKIITLSETIQPGCSLGHYPFSGQTSLGTDELHKDKCGDGVLAEKPDGEAVEKLTDVPSDLGSREVSLNIANTDVKVGEALSSRVKISGTESPGNSDVSLSKLHSHADDNCAVAPVKDYVLALSPPDPQSRTTLSSISEKKQKRAKKNLRSAQGSYPRSLYDTKKNTNPSINVTKHHAWHRASDTPASLVVAAKPKVTVQSPAFLVVAANPKVTVQSPASHVVAAKPKGTVQSSSTFIRKGDCLFRRPSPVVATKPKVSVQSSSNFILKGNCLLRKSSTGSLGEAQTLQRHSKPPSDSTSGECAFSHEIDPLSSGLPGSSSGEADDPDFFQNGLKSFQALIKRGYAADSWPKQNAVNLESSNPSNMLYVKRKANQLVAASDIHGESNRVIPPSGAYIKRSRNQLVRNSKCIPYQENPLSDDALDLRTAAKMASKRSSSLAVSKFAVMRPVKQSKFSHVWRLKEPLSRKTSRVYISPEKILSRKSLLMKNRHTVYRRSANGYSLKKSKVVSIGGSHLKWFNSNEKDSKKPEFLLDVESSRSCPPDVESAYIRNGNQLVRDPKKRTRVLANEKVRWSLQNVRLRSAKKKKYCQFFTKFGKCNKDDGKCPYIHDPSKIAVCTKFLSGLCASPDCRLTHKVVPESMPDCYYYLQGLCNNEVCPYRHVHVNQKAAICEGFLRGYCADGKECRKKHTYTCPVFEATGHCPQESECKLHHPKNRSKEKKRKRASEPWQKISRVRYFGSMHKDLPESERMLVNELATDDLVFGGESPEFIRLDVNDREANKTMDLSTTGSASDDCETQDLINKLIRPVGLMQE